MLLNTHRKQTPSLSFSQELDYLKHRPSPPPSLNKHQEYFSTMTAVLDLLLQAHPTLTDSLLVLKQAVKKWYQYIQEEGVGKNRQLLDMREKLVVYVSKEIGITLEEIGTYIKHFTENYCDQDMRRLYAQFLQAVRKLDWQHPIPSLKNQHSQTQQEQHIDPPTSKSIMTTPYHPSQATIDSPLRRFSDFDVHKYIKIKEENLDLERKINQLNAKIADLSAQNKALKREVSQLHDENMDCRSSRQRELKEVGKLKQLLSELKNEEQLRAQLEEQRRNSFKNAERKFDQCQSLKNALHQCLDSAEMELSNQSELPLESDEHPYRNYTPTEGHQYQTVKKQWKRGELFEQGGNGMRLLLIQALAIQSYISNEQQNS